MKKILIIDEVNQNLEWLVTVLANQPFEIETVNNINFIYPAFYNSNPDIVLMNASTERINGYAISRELIEFSNLNVPIILFSSNEEIIEKILDSKAADFLLQPFTSSELVLKIKTVMQKASFVDQVSSNAGKLIA